jgi:hypothetical protein
MTERGSAETGIVAQLRRIAEIPALSQHVGVEVSEAADCLEAAIPFLRARAASCEACEGAGEHIVGHAPDDYQSEPCKHCKPIWDLIERIEPKRVAAPVAVPSQAAQEEEDVVPF